MNISPQKKKLLSTYYPELQPLLEDTTGVTDVLIASFIDKIESVKGEPGYTPIKGVDYDDGDDGYSPVKGVDYSDGVDGEDGADGQTPTEEELLNLITPLIPDPVPGRDGSPDSPEDIAAKLNTLQGVLNSSVLKNVASKDDLITQRKSMEEGMAKIDGRIKLIDQRWHGGGLSRVSTDSTLTGNGTTASPLSVVPGVIALPLITLTGTVDGVNTSFTASVAPNVIVVDQGRVMQKVSSDGTVNWTGTTNITLTIAPNFDIYGY